jgi:hypothetical protein
MATGLTDFGNTNFVKAGRRATCEMWHGRLLQRCTGNRSCLSSVRGMKKNKFVSADMAVAVMALPAGCATQVPVSAEQQLIDQSKLPGSNVTLTIPGLRPCSDNPNRSAAGLLQTSADRAGALLFWCTQAAAWFGTGACPASATTRIYRPIGASAHGKTEPAADTPAKRVRLIHDAPACPK